MKKKWLIVAGWLLVLSLFTASCGSSGGKNDLLGDEFISVDGSFSIRKPFGYTLQQDGNVVSFSASDAHPEVGPMLMVMGGDTGIEMDNDALFEQTSASLPVMEFGRPKEVTINGVKGLLAGGSAEYDSKPVEGELFVAMVSPTQQFSMIGFAPKDRAKELVNIFDAVLGSVHFTSADSGTVAAVEGKSDPAPIVIQPLRQWASSALASSEYSRTEYTASRATGAPDVENCGDNVNAWASLKPDTEEWLELTYDIPVVPTEINIYQSFNPSTVVEVLLVDTEGDTWVAWTGQPEAVEYCPDLMTITIELEVEILVSQVVVFIDQSVMGWGWTEIDAVELVGFPAGQSPASGGPGQIADSGQPTDSGQKPSSGTGAFSPDSMGSGAFTYQVSGYENDLIENNSVSYNSTDSGYVIALFSGDTGRYAVNLILPREGLKKGRIDLKPYDDKQASKHYMGMIYINAFPYKAPEGWLDIQSDPGSGKITGTFYFTAQSSDFPDRWVTVEGAFKDIPLK
jgi:hypothetical protein